MKKILILLAGLTLLAACKRDDDSPQTGAHPKADSLQRMMNKYTALGVPGAVVSIVDRNGSWEGAAGFARLEDSTRMSPAMLQYGFSITKIFTAVAIMQLKDQGRIDIDRNIDAYLPAAQRDLVPGSDIVTVRMLLNHSSGYNDYVRTDAFAEEFLGDPMKVRTRADYYRLMREHTASLFAPGTDFSYSNTNYYLLSLMIDTLSGKPHADWIREHIIQRLGLKQTFYKGSAGYPAYANLPDAYWTGLDDGAVENISGPQQAWMASEEFGATGMIATPKDYIRLLQGLVNGELVSAASLQEMRQWITGNGSSEPDYGLGLTYWGYRGKAQYGHDGDGIGATSAVMYFPASGTYLMTAANATTEFDGRIAQLLFRFRNELGDYLAGF